MKFRPPPIIPLPARPAVVAVFASTLLLATPAAADDLSGPGTNTSLTTASAEGEEDGAAVSASLRWETAIGIGTFVKGSQNNDLVASTLTPALSWAFHDELTLSGQIAGTWYQVVDFGTPLPKNEFLWSDLALRLSAPDIWSDDDLGLRLTGSLSVFLPTSLASRFQTRLFSLRPGVGLSWTRGPFRISTGARLTKFFTRSSTPKIDCSRWPDSSQCPGGRDPSDPTFENDSTIGVGGLFGPAAGGAFTNSAEGGEVWIPSAGVNSFSIGYGLNLALEIVAGLSVSGGLQMEHIYSVRSFDDDQLSSEHANGGRGQIDRLTSSAGITYQVIRHLAVGSSVTTSTLRPLGARGDDFVVFDFGRAPDNITTWNISVSGSY